MGQDFPIPQRIPKPLEKDIHIMIVWGFKFKDLDLPENKKFIPYELPENWDMRNKTQDSNSPLYYIIDEFKMKRCLIHGIWSCCEKKLMISLLNEPYFPLNEDLKLFDNYFNYLENYEKDDRFTTSTLDIQMNLAINQLKNDFKDINNQRNSVKI